jgi:hypothetical protein
MKQTQKIKDKSILYSMISGLKGATYEEKLAELGLTSLDERRHQTDMLQTFRNQNLTRLRQRE